MMEPADDAELGRILRQARSDPNELTMNEVMYLEWHTGLLLKDVIR